MLAPSCVECEADGHESDPGFCGGQLPIIVDEVVRTMEARHRSDFHAVALQMKTVCDSYPKDHHVPADVVSRLINSTMSLCAASVADADAPALAPASVTKPLLRVSQAGVHWGRMTADEKKPWKDEAAKLRESYDCALRLHERRGGERPKIPPSAYFLWVNSLRRSGGIVMDP